jgi:hypothetical protein
MTPSPQRIALHVICLFRRPRNTWFHLCGIAREFSAQLRPNNKHT